MRDYTKKLILDFIYEDPVQALWLTNFNILFQQNVKTYLLEVRDDQIYLTVNEEWLESTKVTKKLAKTNVITFIILSLFF